jgi:drug/metabolite transporter (DMT)-like permease
LRPIILVLLACAFFAGGNLVAKLIAVTQAANPIHPLEITFGRFLAGFLMVAPLWTTGHAKLRSAVPASYLIRCGGSVGSATCIFISVAYLPLADVTALSFAAPFFALILAALVLGEKVTAARKGAVALGFAGALLITRPTPETFQVMALVPLLAAVLIAVEVTTVRYIAQHDSTGTALVYTNGIGALIAAIALPFVWTVPTWEQIALMCLIGAVIVGGQSLFLTAMAEGESSLLTPLFYSTLVWAALYGWLVFDEIPAPWTWGGAGLIIASGIWLAQSYRAPPA